MKTCVIKSDKIEIASFIHWYFRHLFSIPTPQILSIPTNQRYFKHPFEEQTVRLK